LSCCADICRVPASEACPHTEGTATEERYSLGFTAQETVTAGGKWQGTQHAGDREG